MSRLTEQEYVRKPDGGLAEQIEVLEAFAAGDAENTELLMLLIELRSIRAERAAIKGEQRPAGKIVSWNHPNEERKINFLWLRFDIEPGTFLFTHPAPLKE
ncbi:TPA: hypothetical protein ACGTP8_000245 [Yersinia enterocolitica]